MTPAARATLNRWRRRLARVLLFRIVFGERSQGRLLPHTRISASTCIEHEDLLALGDHVYIGPFNFIEASGGVSLEEGVQITSHVSIVTHSSHRAMRLLGRSYASWSGGRPPGWVAGPVRIGPYSFVGPHTVIEAGTWLGRGTIVCAGSVVRGEFPDFAVLEGRPARMVGDSRGKDETLLAQHPELRAHYDAWAGTDMNHPRSAFGAPPRGGDASEPAEPDPRSPLDHARGESRETPERR